MSDTTRPPTPTLEQWRSRGKMVEAGGHQVFVVDLPGPAQAETLVLLHGYPTASCDFHGVVDQLTTRYRVVVHDHLGFGLSDKPARYSYSLVDQAEVALCLWRKLGVTGGHILAHDYGTSVATELMARHVHGLLAHTFKPQSLTLCNGSVHIELAKLRLVQRALRVKHLGRWVAKLSNPPFFHGQIRRLGGTPQAISRSERELMWAAVTHAVGRARIPQISAYTRERERLWHRWIGALTQLEHLPVHILWGDRDPVAVPAIAKALARETPGAQLTWMEGLGHYPMVEDPMRFAHEVLAWLSARGRG
ncbi:MAG: alpha/beta fold hydrolase [Nannocystaceae bacterium]